MSEVISRPSASRGRGSGRGGRGGFAGRGGRRTNGDHKPEESLGAFDDDGGDIGELRKQYGDKTSVIREMFPDWSEVDVLFALQETNGDQSEAVTRIAEGSISQWGEVSKPKKTSRAKAKDAAPVASSHESSSTGPRAARGGRTVSEGGRGRGRATERGGRSARGRSAAAPTNGARKENQALSIPTEESSAWGNDKPIDDAVEDKEALAEKPALTNEEAPKPAAPAVKTWASMLRQSAVPKAPPKPKEAPAPQAAPEPVEPEPTVEAVEPEPQPEPVAAEPAEESTPVVETATPSEPNVIEPEVALIPSKDELTETNLEQVVDDSQPPPTGTAASTAADSWDPRQNPASVATPLSAAQQQHLTQRPDTSGFAVAAAKATAERTVRTPTHHHHHQRRILDQEEAVRMPGNREVDRAAVQFGAFNLGDGEEDIDGDREEPETRAQPPADSPVAHPRASLPPVAQPTVPETFSQKATTTAPPTTSAASAAPAAPASQAPIPAQTAQPPASNQQQFGRFGQAGAQEAAAAPQKPLDPFNQQNTPSSQPPFDNFPTQTSQPQQPGGAFSSAPSDYSAYYTAAQQDRNPYSYYNQFGQQQGAQGQQESTPSQQRPFAAYGASQADNLSQYPQSGALHNQPRFGGSAGDAQNSGNSTPNPTTQAQQQQPQQPQQQQQGAQGSQPQSHGQQYPGGYNHPYYSNPYYQHYYSGYNQGGFGPYAGKGNVYGQPYGVSPNAPYDHTSSPAAFSQSSLHRDSGLGASGLGDYGRATSSQAGSQPGLGGSSFGGVHDSFARGASSFQGQGQSFNSQTQPGNAASSDELKPFGETKPASGPSPSIGGARPGSATNAPAAQSGLPPPGNSQMGGGYGGYPSHLQGHGLHGSNAYGMGGNAGASQHGNSAYGSYGQGFGGNSPYYGNQQQQQQRGGGGWGGNYH